MNGICNQSRVACRTAAEEGAVKVTAVNGIGDVLYVCTFIAAVVDTGDRAAAENGADISADGGFQVTAVKVARQGKAFDIGSDVLYGACGATGRAAVEVTRQNCRFDVGGSVARCTGAAACTVKGSALDGGNVAANTGNGAAAASRVEGSGKLNGFDVVINGKGFVFTVHLNRACSNLCLVLAAARAGAAVVNARGGIPLLTRHNKTVDVVDDGAYHGRIAGPVSAAVHTVQGGILNVIDDLAAVSAANGKEVAGNITVFKGVGNSSLNAATAVNIAKGAVLGNHVHIARDLVRGKHGAEHNGCMIISFGKLHNEVYVTRYAQSAVQKVDLLYDTARPAEGDITVFGKTRHITSVRDDLAGGALLDIKLCGGGGIAALNGRSGNGGSICIQDQFTDGIDGTNVHVACKAVQMDKFHLCRSLIGIRDLGRGQKITYRVDTSTEGHRLAPDNGRNYLAVFAVAFYVCLRPACVSGGGIVIAEYVPLGCRRRAGGADGGTDRLEPEVACLGVIGIVIVDLVDQFIRIVAEGNGGGNRCIVISLNLQILLVEGTTGLVGYDNVPGIVCHKIREFLILDTLGSLAVPFGINRPLAVFVFHPGPHGFRLDTGGIGVNHPQINAQVSCHQMQLVTHIVGAGGAHHQKVDDVVVVDIVINGIFEMIFAVHLQNRRVCSLLQHFAQILIQIVSRRSPVVFSAVQTQNYLVVNAGVQVLPAAGITCVAVVTVKRPVCTGQILIHVFHAVFIGKHRAGSVIFRGIADLIPSIAARKTSHVRGNQL